MGFICRCCGRSRPALSLRRGDCAGIDDFVRGLILPRVLRQRFMVMVAWVLGIAAVWFHCHCLTAACWFGAGSCKRRCLEGYIFQKNTLGSYTALGMVVFYLIGRNKRGQRGVWLMFELMVLLTAFSRSGTGLVVVTLTLAALFAFRYLRYHWHPMFIPVALMSAVVFVILAVAVFYATAAVPFLRLVGKDLTLRAYPGMDIDVGYGYAEAMAGLWIQWLLERLGKSPGGWYVEQIELRTAAWPQWFYGYALVTVAQLAWPCCC